MIPNMKEYVEFISITEAMELAKSRGVPASRPTVIRWCKHNNIGVQFGGVNASWRVDKAKLEALLSGK
jgi:intein-encoded DNA endonuclease-like protein